MARDTRAAFERELAKVEPELARSFREAVGDITSAAQIGQIDEIARAFLNGQIGIEDAVRRMSVALNLGPQFWAPLDRAIVNSFLAGALYQQSLVPARRPGGQRLVVRFDSTNPEAREWTAQEAGRLISEIDEGARVTIRETLTEARDNNITYRQIARQLVGQKVGEKRVGGLIGLHSKQAAAVRSVRSALESGDYEDYFSRAKSMRNGNVDRQLRAAIKRGEKPSRELIDKAVREYADRQLRLRADTIARTEGNRAMNEGRRQMVQQMIERGQVSADKITKVWNAVIGQFTRDSHLALNGQEVPWGQKFVSPVTFAQLDYPHDPSAPASEVVNCRCTLSTRIDWRP